jgi:hypothetical protein
LTPLLDSWSKYEANKLVILGNGASRSQGLEFARQESIPIVSINSIDQKCDLIFTVVTRVGLLAQLEADNSQEVPLIVPAGFPASKNSVPLPISEFEYIEGLTVNDASRVGFREDFVLITILDLLNVLAKHRLSEKDSVEVHLYGFDFEINPGNDRKAEE